MPKDVDVSANRVGAWAEDNLVPIMAEYLWEDALHSIGEADEQEGRIDSAQRFIDEYRNEESINGCYRDARQIVRAVEAHYFPNDIEAVVEWFEAESDLDEFAYYLVMQTLGHGVAWSDDHEEELWTPDWDAAMWYSHEDASEAADDYIERLDAEEFVVSQF